MKTLGILGGLSPQSTLEYYRAINAGVNAALGGHHSAKILMASVDFGEFVMLKAEGNWHRQGEILAENAAKLEQAGADVIILATNTLHKEAAQIEAAISVPFLHIGAVTAAAIADASLNKVALLGTRYTMEMDFYKAFLSAHGIETFTPEPTGIEAIHNIIYDELVAGIISTQSRHVFVEEIERLQERIAKKLGYELVDHRLELYGRKIKK